MHQCYQLSGNSGRGPLRLSPIVAEGEAVPYQTLTKLLPLFRVAILGSVLVLIVAACQRGKSSSVKTTPANLEVTGTLLLGDGRPAAGAKVFVSSDDQPIGEADGSGSFKLVFDEARRAALLNYRVGRGHQQVATDTQLFFSFADGNGSKVGRSQFFAINNTAAKDLGSIRLEAPSKLQGKVQFGSSAAELRPAANVVVSADQSQTASDAEGNFSLDNLAAGPVRLYAAGQDTSLSIVNITLQAGIDNSLDFALQVYPKDAIDGLLIAIPQKDKAELIPGRPNQRDFRVLRTANARYLKISNAPDQLQAAASWQMASDLVSFDFPDNGAHTLYYQFADSSQTTTSKPSSSKVATNPFAGSKGIIIGDGSGLAASRNVTVSVDLPAAATEMRLAETPEALASNSTLPFIKAQSSINYVFTVQRSPENTESKMVETMLRTLYCQFKAADGIISPTFKATVRITPFPETLTSDDAFTIGDGSGRFGGVKVPVKIKIPANAFEMRLWEEDRQITTVAGGILTITGGREQLQKVFFPVTESVDFLFNTTGHKTMFLQFRDIDGLTSSIYRQNVLVGAMKSVDYGFAINDGSGFTINRELIINLNVPEGATSFRISEDSVAINNLALDVVPESRTVSFLAGGTGLRTIYLQYGDAVNNLSKTYFQTVTIDPFNGDPGSFTINGGEELTMIPAAVLNIRPPAPAVQMEVTRAVGGPNISPFCGSDTVVTLTATATFNRWAAIVEQFDIVLPTVGPSVYCIRFRNLAGDVSPFIVQRIIYDPFPVDLGGVDIRKQPDNRVNARDIVLDIAIPPRARHMRVASSISAIASTPFRELEDSINWYLAKPGPAGDDRYFEVFVQFVTEFGELSTIYSDNVLLEIFPTANLTATLSVLAVGATSTDLNITLDPPLTATGIKIGDTYAGVATAAVVPIQPGLSYTVSGTTGTKTLFFRYVAADATESQIFSASIDL